MKKPTCLILTIIGVLLLIVGLVVVVPWLVNIVQEFTEMQEKHDEYAISIRQDANTPLNEEQQGLYEIILMEHSEISTTQKPDELEGMLSTEPYLTYLNIQDGEIYSDYNVFINMMPTQNHKSIAMSRLVQFLDTEIGEVTQKIWLDFYYRLREWGKDGKTQLNSGKEFNDILQKHLVEPLMENSSDTGGFSSMVIKMGIVSAVMVEDNEVFHRAWYHRIQSYGLQEGYLMSAIATPAEFALMRSFFENAEVFVKWLSEPFGLEEENVEPENQ